MKVFVLCLLLKMGYCCTTAVPRASTNSKECDLIVISPAVCYWLINVSLPGFIEHERAISYTAL